VKEIVSLNHESITIVLPILKISHSFVMQDTNKSRKGKMFHSFQIDKLKISRKSVITTTSIFLQHCIECYNTQKRLQHCIKYSHFFD